VGWGVFGGAGPSIAILMGAALWTAACSAAAPQNQPSPQAPAGLMPAGPAEPVAISGERGTLMGADDLDRLRKLSDRRASLGEESTYRIGPDDLLDIRIPDLTDARPYGEGAQAGGVATVAGAPTFHQGERVDDSGDISIPHVGVIRAAGLTPAQLEAEISRRLVSAGILRRPQVAVLIAEYRSRVVAVVGSVERPGTYPLTRPGATVADMIWAAGGPGQGAGRMVLFSPAPDAVRVASSSDVVAANAEVRSDADPGLLPPGTKPIRIDLQALLRASDAGGSLNPQVRPGDVISLAQAGSVLVEGWVDKPGSYPVTPGLTLSGAIVAAGGGVYAADLEAVSVRRTLSPGEQRTIPVDLTAISEGREPDLPILDGDVVNVPVHSTKIVPYGIWKVGREIIHVGASVPIF
jgi:polysaccharide biosynthesis/export protein